MSSITDEHKCAVFLVNFRSCSLHCSMF